MLHPIKLLQKVTSLIMCLLFQAAFDRADTFGQQGNNLIDQNHYALDCIKPKCSEISTKTHEISEKIKKRAMVLERSLDLQQRIEKVSCFI